MDTKEMKDRIKKKAAESGVIKQAPEPRAPPRRVRSYKSLIINLVALIGLFALVFVLQQVGTRHVEQTAQQEPAPQAEPTPSVTTTEVAVKVVPPAIKTSADPHYYNGGARQRFSGGPVNKPFERAEVEVVDITTSAEGAAQPRAEAKIILRTKTTERKPVTTTSRRTAPYRTRGLWAEDRARSAELVDMLDGPAARRRERRAERATWADNVPMPATRTTSSNIEETTLAPGTRTYTYATAAPQKKPTYVAPTRRPSWDVNAGSPR